MGISEYVRLGIQHFPLATLSGLLVILLHKIFLCNFFCVKEKSSILLYGIILNVETYLLLTIENLINEFVNALIKCIFLSSMQKRVLLSNKTKFGPYKLFQALLSLHQMYLKPYRLLRFLLLRIY